MDEFVYSSAEDLDSYPYWANHHVYAGGGYVFELKSNQFQIQRKMDELKELEWIDRYTRAIFIEFSVYNPNVDLFGTVTLVAEVLTSGGLNPYVRVDSVNLLGNYQKSFGFQLLCEIAFLVDRKSTRLNSSHIATSRMPSSA